jgi:O-antigen/teichoic acid export membrane protein
MHNIKNLIQNVGWLFVGTIFSNVISIFVTIFLIRKLPIEDFGIYSLFLGSLGMFGIFSINGAIVALRRYIPELIQKKYYSYLKIFVRNLYFFSFSLGVFIIIVVFIFKNEVGVILQIKKFDIYFSIFIINIILFLQSTFNNSVLTTIYEQKFLSIVNLISIMFRGILYAIFIHVITIELIFIIEAIALGVNAIAGIIYTFLKINNIGSDDEVSISPEEIKVNRKRMRKYVALSTADEMGESAFSQVSDYYFISAFLGPEAIGMYAFPYKLISSVLTWIPFTYIIRIIKPYYISQYYETGENKIFLNIVYNFFTKMVLLFLGYILIMIISYQNLINIYLFNSKYLGTQTLLLIIIPYFLVGAFTYPNYLVLEISEKIQYTLYSKIFAVFNIMADYFVLKYTSWGLLGVGAATGLSALLKNYYIYFYVKKRTSISLNVSELFKSVLLLLILAIVVISASYINSLVLKIIFPIALSFILILLLIKILGPFNQEEKKQLNKLFEMIPLKIDFMRRILVFTIN